MSYDISLADPVTGETLELDAPHYMRGGTYAVGGTTDAHLNVTWNYAKHYYRIFTPAPLRPDRGYPIKPDATASVPDARRVRFVKFRLCTRVRTAPGVRHRKTSRLGVETSIILASFTGSGDLPFWSAPLWIDVDDAVGLTIRCRASFCSMG